MTGPFCRSCGIEVFRRQMAHTLGAGWWGVISFVTNFGVILGNLRARRAITTLAEPLASPIRPPLPSGRPLWRRPATWVAPALVTLLVIVIGAAVTNRTGASSFSGRCVRFDAGHTKVLKVSCSDSHDGKVIGVAATKVTCPIGTSITFRLKVEEDKVLCVDLDQ